MPRSPESWTDADGFSLGFGFAFGSAVDAFGTAVDFDPERLALAADPFFPAAVLAGTRFFFEAGFFLEVGFLAGDFALEPEAAAFFLAGDFLLVLFFDVSDSPSDMVLFYPNRT